jgi:hypothetical protein
LLDEGFARYRDHWKLAASGSSLDRHPGELPGDALDLPADPEYVIGQVHVFPRKAKDFSPAQPVHQQQDKCWIERIVPRHRQELAHFVSRPWPVAGRGCRWQGRQAGRIHEDQFLPHGPGECRA